MRPRDIALERMLRRARTQEGGAVWREVAERLRSPRSLSETNVSKINRYTQDGDTAVVPGRVLGSGRMDHAVKVAAYDFTRGALSKLRDAGCEAVRIEDMVAENPSGEGVKLIV